VDGSAQRESKPVRALTGGWKPRHGDANLHAGMSRVDRVLIEQKFSMCTR
jgi:hypothetical protein